VCARARAIARSGRTTTTRRDARARAHARHRSIARAMEAYRKAYIVTGKFAPVTHFMVRSMRARASAGDRREFGRWSAGVSIAREGCARVRERARALDA